VLDDLSRELENLEGTHPVRVALSSDAEGYLQRECPNPGCLARFTVRADDWSTLVADEVVFCPLCRHEADSDRWFTPEQIDYGKRVALHQMKGRIDRAFVRGVRSANSRVSSGGFISFSFEYKPGRRTYVAPQAAGPALEQRSTCEVCSCRYASIGAAFFCPACGHNSARSTFGGTLSTVRASLELLPKLAEMVGTDSAADLSRGIAENAMVKLVTAFQRFAEATYDALPDPKKAASFNVFQRLDEGADLFRRATRRSYGDILNRAELIELERCFQQRHLLVHEDGIVDERYIERSGDTSYRLGQRLVIKPAGVRRAADLIETLAHGIAQ
jgi:hypothetical protein